MVKRVLVILFAMTLLLASISVARADVVFFNDFFEQNYDKTQHINLARFYANGPGGAVSVKKEPGRGKKSIHT